MKFAKIKNLHKHDLIAFQPSNDKAAHIYRILDNPVVDGTVVKQVQLLCLGYAENNHLKFNDELNAVDMIVFKSTEDEVLSIELDII